MRKLATYILLFIYSVVIAQENEPDNTLNSYGITFPEGQYDVPDLSSNFIKDTIYIDFSAVSDGTGTQSDPWKYVYGKTLTDSTAYLFKRDVAHSETNRHIDWRADHILVGAWSTGDRPIVTFYTLEFLGDSVNVRDINFRNVTTKHGRENELFTGGWFYNCDFNRVIGWGGSAWGGLDVFSKNVKIIRNNFKGQLEDACFIKGTAIGKNPAYHEFAYNTSSECNQHWYIENVTPGGDVLQLSGVSEVDVHHNVMDRSTTGNKFCIIHRDAFNIWEGTPMVSNIYENIMIGPNNESDPFGQSYGGAGAYFEEQNDIAFYKNQITFNHTSLTGLYNGADADGLDIFGNIFKGASRALRSSDPVKFYNNTCIGQDELISGSLPSAYIKNNIFELFDSRYNNGTNFFVENEGASNLFVDPNNDDYRPKAGSVIIDAVSWDGANMNAIFTTDINGVANPKDNTMEAGALFEGSPATSFCDGITITQSGVITDADVNQSNGAIDVTVGGNGIPPYTYLWSSGQTTEDISGIPAGSYTLTVTDDSSCFNSKTYEVANIASDSSLTIVAVQANGNDGRLPEWSIDNNFNDTSRWSYNAIPSIIVYDLGDTFNVRSVNFTMLNYDTRQWFFDIYMSYDSSTVNGSVYSDTTTLGVQTENFIINQVGRYIHVLGKGNSSTSDWTSIIEFDAFGSSVSAPIATNWIDSLDNWWKFNGNFIDSIGSNDGTGTNIEFVSGRNGGADSAINTTNAGYVVISDLNFGASEEWTLSWWQYATSTFKIVGNYDGSNEIIYVSNGNIQFDNTGTPQTVDGGLNLNEWHMATLVAKSNNYLTLYTDTVTTDSVLLTDNALRLTHIGGVSTQFDGYMDDWRVGRNVAFTDDGVYSMYYDFADSTSPCDTVNYSITGSVTNVNCFGGSDGAIDITVVGGGGSNTYLWSNGETTEDLINIPVSVYSVTVTDVDGCQGTESFGVTQPDSALLVTFINVVGDSCFGENQSTATILAKGGTSPFTYQWLDNNVTTQTIDTLRSNYEYTVVTTDNNSCKDTSNLTIDGASQIAFNQSLQGVMKEDTNSTGVGQLLTSISGGTPPYSYDWETGDTTINLDSLFTGTYRLIITDNYNCVDTGYFNVANIITGLVAKTVSTFNQKVLAKSNKVLIPTFDPNFSPCTVCGVLDFDGVDDYVSFSSIPDVSGSKTLTFHAYIGNSADGYFFSILDANEGFSAFINGSGDLEIVCRRGTNDINSSGTVDISSFLNQVIEVEIEKATNSLVSVKINNVLQSVTFGFAGVFVSPLCEVGRTGTEYLTNANVWNIQVSDFNAPGQPNGNQSSAWSNGIYTATVNGSPTTTDIK